ISAQGVAYGGSAVEPPHPSRAGYMFLGWDKPFDNVTSDLTVRAMFEVIAAAPPGPGEWGLLNLILAFLGLGVALTFVVRAIRKEKQAGKELDEKHAFAWLCVSVVAAIIGIVFFFLTEDTSLPMTITDDWTVVNVLIFIVVVMAAVLTLRRTAESHKVFMSGSPLVGHTKKGSPYTFALEDNYNGAVSYRIGNDGEWKQVFPDENGKYTIPKEELTEDVYLEYRP
ncbi:MAG: InlB B-repeat-containing protein, partial [Methanomassiliicoccaceae archaeon]|nr:InlB B-repeat-containing protein [Methanomassiliicoccaceae archaeon]